MTPRIWVCEGCGAVFYLAVNIQPPRDDHGRPACPECVAAALQLGVPSVTVATPPL